MLLLFFTAVHQELFGHCFGLAFLVVGLLHVVLGHLALTFQSLSGPLKLGAGGCPPPPPPNNFQKGVVA